MELQGADYAGKVQLHNLQPYSKSRVSVQAIAFAPLCMVSSRTFMWKHRQPLAQMTVILCALSSM